MSAVTLPSFLLQLDESLVAPTVLAAVVAGFVTLATPWIAERLKLSSAARLKELEGQERFYRDLQARYDDVLESLDRAHKVNLELQRRAIAWDAERRALHARLDNIAEDMDELRGLVEEHLTGHPEAAALAELATRVLDRVRRGREEAS